MSGLGLSARELGGTRGTLIKRKGKLGEVKEGGKGKVREVGEKGKVGRGVRVERR